MSNRRYRRNSVDKSKLEYDNTIRYLEHKGWRRLDFYIDLEYLSQLGIDFILAETGDFLFTMVNELTTPSRSWISNIMSILGRYNLKYWRDYLSILTPNPILNKIRNRSRDYVLQSKSDKDGLDSILFNKIVDYLGTPKSIYQEVSEGDWSNASSNILTLPPEYFVNYQSLDIYGRIYCYFDNEIEIETSIEYIGALKQEQITKIYFPNKELRSIIINKALKNTSIIKSSSNSTTIGEINSKYSLSSFSSEISLITKQIKKEIYEIDSSNNSEKLSILFQGNSGVGKTSLVNALVKEIVSPLNYLIINLDLESLSDYIPIPYVDKVCLIINDGDNLAIDRRERRDGLTERVMSLLDGNYLNCLSPLNNNTIKLLIFITANTTERWDIAAMRKGRIDMSYNFDKAIY